MRELTVAYMPPASDDPRDVDAAMPERHLGLLPAAEIEGLLQRIDHMADLLAPTAAAGLPPPVTVTSTASPRMRALRA